jgi:hypothetical protein
MTFTDLQEALENPGLHLSKELILEQISEEKIWSVTLGFEPNENDYITSPYREDNSPGCKFIRNKQSGLLCFYDGAAIGSKLNGLGIHIVDCFQSIQILKNIPLGLVLSKLQVIINQGKLEGLELGSSKVKKSKISKTKKTETLIYYWSREWNKWDSQYWFPYGITKSQLESDGTIPINAWGMKGEGSKWRKFHCSHWCSYIINDDSWGSKMKGYQPFVKGLRFFGNVNKDCIGGLWSLNGDTDKIIIAKSYKDWRVFKNAGFNVIWFQNEGMIPDLKLLKKFKDCNFIIIFDNDKAGIKAAIHVRDTMIKEEFKVIAKCLNRNFLKNKIKDPADLRKEKESVFNHTFNNGKINEKKIYKGREYGILETIPQKVLGL